MDADTRDFLEGVALRGGVASVRLIDGPAGDGDHTLAIHVLGEPQPSLFIARPAGQQTEVGHLLQLRPFTRQSSVAAAEGTATKERDTGVQLKFALGEHVGRALAGGKLRVDVALGAGGAGAVYRATHRDLRRDVAVKLMRKSADADLEVTERFQAEALAAVRLDHPNLVRVLDFGEEPDGLLYLSMEYLEGLSLEKLLVRLGRLSLERASEIMVQVCAGLWHAHSRGVIHRDVKPSNVMLVTGHDDDGRPVEIVKVCDFGIALSSDGVRDRRAAGTPEYMSPEQCRGAPLDGRSDVYSCGVTLYELVTGRRPFEGDSAEDIARQHVLMRPPPLSHFVPAIEPDLERIVLRALEKAPESRFASARELRQALTELLARRSQSGPLSGPPAMRPPQTSMPSVPVAPMTAQREPSRVPPAPGVPSASPAPPVAPKKDPRDASGVIAVAPRIATPPAPPPAESPADWLEDARASYDNFFADAGAASDVGAYHEGDALLRELAASPAAKLRELASLRGGPEFAPQAAALEVAVKPLARRGDAAALSEIVRVMAAIYTEDRSQPRPTGAGERALKVLHAVAEPTTLGLLAEKLLVDSSVPWEVASALFTWAQGTGAAALYSARMRVRAPGARSRFVTLMRGVGAHATPVLLSALRQLLPEGETNVSDVALAEDLLNAVPPATDAQMGALASRFVSLDRVELRSAAMPVLAAAWGGTAIPQLLRGLDDHFEEVRVAAIAGLRDVRAIEEGVVLKLAAFLEPSTGHTDELRVASADGLAWASPLAKATATKLVLAALARPDDVLSLVRGRRAGPAVLLSLARSAMLLSPSEAGPRVRTRAEKSPEPLRGQLLAIAARAM